jgi:hypothetical protein
MVSGIHREVWGTGLPCLVFGTEAYQDSSHCSKTELLVIMLHSCGSRAC